MRRRAVGLFPIAALATALVACEVGSVQPAEPGLGDHHNGGDNDNRTSDAGKPTDATEPADGDPCQIAVEICSDDIDQDCDGDDPACSACGLGPIINRCDCAAGIHETGSCCVGGWSAGACPAATISVSPDTVTLIPEGTVQFTATTAGLANNAVTWTVEEGGGGSVDSTGYYTAPSGVAPAGCCHVRARSVAQASLSAVATIGIVEPGPVDPTAVLPLDRATAWNPGLLASGGIPHRTTSCASVQAATYDHGAEDATAAIQAALDSCPIGQVVNLSAGVFRIDDDILHLDKGVTLRGAGAGATFVQRTNGAVDGVDDAGVARPVIIVGQSRWTWGETSTDLTTPAAKGADSVVVASAAGLQIGMLVLLDELSGATWMPDPQGHSRQVWASPDWRTVWQVHNPEVEIIDDPMPAAASWFSRDDRPTAEIHEIAAIAGNTVTFTTPIHISYRTTHTAQLTRLGYPAVRAAGIEAMTVTGGDDGNIRFVNAVGCWAKNIEVSTWRGEGFALSFTHRIEIRDSYIHDAAYSTPGGGAYAISIQEGSSEALIENNVVLRSNKVIVARCSGAGTVVAYNYMDQGFIDYNPGWQEMGVGGSHMVGPHHMLFEGNLSFNGDNDHTHGNSIYHTYFRNHLTGYRSAFTSNTGLNIDDLADVPGDNGPRRCAGASAFSYWMSFVGNILGLPGAMDSWAYESDHADDVIWALGWENHGNLFDADANVAANILRNGNYDHLTGTVHWHGIGDAGATPTSLPDSLYRPAKPAFFGGHPWPWVDASTGTTYVLPAQARYQAGTPNVVP